MYVNIELSNLRGLCPHFQEIFNSKFNNLIIILKQLKHLNINVGAFRQIGLPICVL